MKPRFDAKNKGEAARAYEDVTLLHTLFILTFAFVNLTYAFANLTFVFVDLTFHFYNLTFHFYNFLDAGIPEMQGACEMEERSKNLEVGKKTCFQARQ